MDYYSFDEIRQVADCCELARDVFGAKVKGERCAATWRGGDNATMVHIKKDKWFDNKIKKGGGAKELIAYKFNGNKQAAQAFLGEYYKLTPKYRMQKNPVPSRNRYTSLIAEGYKEVARYEYKDLDGNVRHFTVRMEHPERKKEFVQGHENGQGIAWNLNDVETILYRLPKIVDSDYVILCEGEKSAETLAAMGLPATTVPMGAGKFNDSYIKPLVKKTVIICPDNDEPGRHHADIVARALYGKAKVVCIIEPDESLPPKAGIDDWFNAGHTKNEFMQRVKDAPEWKPAEPEVSGCDHIHTVSRSQLETAAKANNIPFRNYIPVKIEKKNANGKTVQAIDKEPRQPPDIIDDVHRRFLGFPRKVGKSSIFDHDRDTNEIIELRDEHALFAWIGRKSKKTPDWIAAAGYLPKKEMYENIIVKSKRYESIAKAPSWPVRKDVYYAHPPLPEPSLTHKYLAELTDMFLPANDIDFALITTLICAPLWYIPGIDRPAWVIDSPDGFGAGKSTLVNQIALLYQGKPIETTQREFEQDTERIRRRCLSQEGRNARIMMVDNVKGSWSSPAFASLVTTPDITGMAPFGRGEESRPNDLTYVITANTAHLSAEITDRCLFINIKKPPKSMSHDSWKMKIQAYINKHRYQIIADIVDLIKNHKKFLELPLETRFREFETNVLHPCCGSPDAAREVITAIKQQRADSSTDNGQAEAIRDFINQGLRNLNIDEETPCYISIPVINSWARKGLNDIADELKGRPLQLIMDLVKTQLLKEARIEPRQIMRRNGRDVKGYRGIGWHMKDHLNPFFFIYRNHDNPPNAIWVD